MYWLFPATLYGGFFAVDLRMLGLVTLLALLLGVATALAVRKLHWSRGMLPLAIAGTLVYLALLLLVFHWLVDYPVLVIRSFFEIR